MTMPSPSQAYLAETPSPADIERLFGIGVAARERVTGAHLAAALPRADRDKVAAAIGALRGDGITGAHMAATHLRADADMLVYDLNVVRKLWGADETSYWREPTTRDLLLTCGLIKPEPFELDATEYLRYIAVLFQGDYELCPDPEALQPTWLMVQKQMVLLQHWIYNLRITGGNPDSVAGSHHRWENVFQLHRESTANVRMFEHIAKVAKPGLTRDPARDIVVDTDQLAARFPPTLPLWNATFHYANVFLRLPPSLSTAIANQFAGPPGLESSFGLRAFIRGEVALVGIRGRDRYVADDLLRPRLEKWLERTGHPPTGPLGPVTTADLVDLIYQMTSWAGGPVRFTPPSSDVGSTITVAELRDFLIGMSNALINELNAPFADLLPPSDICALEHDITEGDLREHVEMQYTERILDDMATL